jgi:hypothetical protein
LPREIAQTKYKKHLNGKCPVYCQPAKQPPNRAEKGTADLGAPGGDRSFKGTGRESGEAKTAQDFSSYSAKRFLLVDGFGTKHVLSYDTFLNSIRTKAIPDQRKRLGISMGGFLAAFLASFSAEAARACYVIVQGTSEFVVFSGAEVHPAQSNKRIHLVLHSEQGANSHPFVALELFGEKPDPRSLDRVIGLKVERVSHF